MKITLEVVVENPSPEALLGAYSHAAEAAGIVGVPASSVLLIERTDEIVETAFGDGRRFASCLGTREDGGSVLAIHEYENACGSSRFQFRASGRVLDCGTEGSDRVAVALTLDADNRDGLDALSLVLELLFQEWLRLFVVVSGRIGPRGEDTWWALENRDMRRADCFVHRAHDRVRSPGWRLYVSELLGARLASLAGISYVSASGTLVELQFPGSILDMEQEGARDQWAASLGGVLW